MAETDPFTQVYNGLWSLALQSVPLEALLKPKNRIMLSDPNDPTNRDPVKKNIQDADMPELILSTEGLSTINMHASSCSAMIERTYSWMLSTGDYRVSLHLYEVQWAIYCAMLDFPDVLGQLTWQGDKFVKACQYGGLTEGLSNPTLNRGIKGWTSMWKLNVKMYFSQAQMRAFNTGA